MEAEVELTTTCRWCKKDYTFSVPLKGLEVWHSGMVPAQNAFPMLSADQRELLISGTCPKCLDKMCGDSHKNAED